MIHYSYLNDEEISFQQKKEAQQAWTEKLGKFKDEFDEKKGSVTINFGVSTENDNYYHFNLPEPYSVFEFNHRFNEWVRAGRP